MTAGRRLPRVRALLGLGLVGASILACAGAQPPPGEPCPTSQKAALDRVEKVTADNQACVADTDCFVLELHTTCFDVCYRAVNAAGKGAVDRAETLVEASECKKFHANQCKLEVPPCGPPPAAAKCVEGRCGV